MRAAILRGPRDLVVAEVAEPVAGDFDIVVQVGAAGICGSDLTSYATGAYVRPGQIMGHEFAGTVVEAGDGTRGFALGQRVTVRPLGQCGQCRACALGLRHVCERAVRDALGYGHPGAFADRVRVPNAVLGGNVFAVNDDIDDASAAMVEVFAVALHACRRLELSIDSSCVVLGLGPVGLAAVQVLGSMGVGRVVGIDNSELRRERAARTGAAVVSGFDGLEDAVRGVAGAGPRAKGAGADAVLEASGALPLLQAAPSLLRSGGRLGLVALYKEAISLDMNEWVARELELVGCYGYDAEFADALELVQDHAVDPRQLITGSFALEESVAAFAAQADPDRHIKVQLRHLREVSS